MRSISKSTLVFIALLIAWAVFMNYLAEGRVHVHTLLEWNATPTAIVTIPCILLSAMPRLRLMVSRVCMVLLMLLIQNIQNLQKGK